MKYSTFAGTPKQPAVEYHGTDGISAQGVITLLVIAAIAVVVKRSGRAKNAAPEKAPKQQPPASGIPPGNLPVVSMEKLRGDVPEQSAQAPSGERAMGKGKELLSAPVTKAWAHRLDIPYELAERLQKSKWSQMCSSRRLAGLERGDVEATPYGVAVHVAFRGALDFATVQRGLDQIETGLDVATGTVRLRRGGTAGRGVLDVRIRDPLADGVPWEEPAVPVRLAHPVRLAVTPFGDTVELSLKQRVGVFGTSGSGKSCVQRLIGAHAAASIDADLEIWDLKFGVESQHYAGKAHRVTSVEDAVSRLDWLLNVEYPRRAAKMKERGVSEWTETPWDPARVVIIDEGNVVIRGFGEWKPGREEGDAAGSKGAPLKDLFTAIEQGRALGVFWVWATQFPKAVSLPTEIRSQLNATVCLKMKTSEEAAVVFKDDVRDGWAPQDLLGPGWLMVKDDAHTVPVDAKAVWLSVDTFRSVPLGGQDKDPDRTPLVLRTPGQSLSPDRTATGQDTVRLSAVPDRTAATVSMDIWTVLALSTDSLSLSEIARRCERSKSAVHAALGRMEDDGRVWKDDTGYRLATTEEGGGE